MPLMTIARFARVIVSSRRMTTSPAITRTPSRTRSSPTTPPVGCCTFLTFESTTREPDATTAPDSSVVVAQPPRPPTTRSPMVIAARTWRRIERLAPLALVLITSPRLAFRCELYWAQMGLCALKHFLQHLLLWSEGLHAPVRDRQEQVDAQQGRRTMGDHDHDGAAFACPENGLR